MATPAPTPTKKATGWTEQEKYQFLLKIIGQIGGGAGGALKGIHPKFDEIDLNGRTAKAMSLMWGKIKNEIPVSTNGVKAPVSTPRKRKANGGGKQEKPFPMAGLRDTDGSL